MKQLYEELYKIHNWCFCCPYTDLHRGVGKYRDKDKEEDPPLSGLHSIRTNYTNFLSTLSSEELVKRVIESTIAKEIAEEHIPTPEEVAAEKEEEHKREWEMWEESFDFSMKGHYYITCPYIKKKGLVLNLNRDLVVPDSDIEILRLLDKLSQCSTEECAFNREQFRRHGTVIHNIRQAIAKVDFALIEAGKDYGKIMSEMYFHYYERRYDIYECGYSQELVDYYMDKYGFKMLSNEEYYSMETTEQDREFMQKEEFQDALKDGLCNEKGVLLVKKAEYTRYAKDKYDIKTSYKSKWQRFDQIFTDANGKPISYKSFMQSYRDQGLD